jgi:hypothetical protein
MGKCVNTGRLIFLPVDVSSNIFVNQTLINKSLFLFLGLCVGSHNSQHISLTFIHNELMDGAFFTLLSFRFKDNATVMMLASPVGDVIEEATV